ncbi:MAG: hypothetical protein NZR01_13675 [Bryobacteraceae bacterium]|nr:hypothetical protein [Bryobacteraceae bacterium]
MSSDWRPARARLFDLWLIPPGRSCPFPERPLVAPPAPDSPGGPLPEAGAQPDSPCRTADGEPLTAGPPVRFCIDSRGWTAAASSVAAPVSIAVEWEGAVTPPQRLHPAERKRLEKMPPEERAAARKLLAAARRALAAALGLPASAAFQAASLAPLLDGAQSLRVGGWTVQRVPAPWGVFVFAAAPGWGWEYTLAPDVPSLAGRGLTRAEG